MIDGYKLIMSLNDWWYSSFGYEETEESKAIKKVIDEVEKYVEQAEQTEPQYDFGAYADRLWKIAYERGKREALEQTERSE